MYSQQLAHTRLVLLLSHFSHVQLFATLWTVAYQSSVHRILQARILEWVATPSSGNLSHPGIELMSLTSPALTDELFVTSATWESQAHVHKCV